MKTCKDCIYLGTEREHVGSYPETKIREAHYCRLYPKKRRVSRHHDWCGQLTTDDNPITQKFLKDLTDQLRLINHE